MVVALCGGACWWGCGDTRREGEGGEGGGRQKRVPWVSDKNNTAVRSAIRICNQYGTYCTSVLCQSRPRIDTGVRFVVERHDRRDQEEGAARPASQIESGVTRGRHSSKLRSTSPASCWHLSPETAVTVYASGAPSTSMPPRKIELADASSHDMLHRMAYADNMRTRAACCQTSRNSE